MIYLHAHTNLFRLIINWFDKNGAYSICIRDRFVWCVSVCVCAVAVWHDAMWFYSKNQIMNIWNPSQSNAPLNAGDSSTKYNEKRQQNTGGFQWMRMKLLATSKTGKKWLPVISTKIEEQITKLWYKFNDSLIFTCNRAVIAFQISKKWWEKNGRNHTKWSNKLE